MKVEIDRQLLKDILIALNWHSQETDTHSVLISRFDSDKQIWITHSNYSDYSFDLITKALKQTNIEPTEWMAKIIENKMKIPL